MRKGPSRPKAQPKVARKPKIAPQQNALEELRAPRVIKKPQKINKKRLRRTPPRSPEAPKTWMDNLSLSASLLGMILTLIAVVQITVWLTSLGRILVDQNRIEMINQLVNQTAEASKGPTPKAPLCMEPGEHQLTFYICDGKVLVAVDEYKLTAPDGPAEEKLAIRRFYTDQGVTVKAIDRYEYNADFELVQKDRIIFQKVLGVYTCAYLETIYDPTGITLKTSFHGSCGSGMGEIPTHTYILKSSPPPISLFIPYHP
jgi:hypothetical protein